MATILALDLGKFKTVACWYNVGSGDARFQTTLSNRAEGSRLGEVRQQVNGQAGEHIVGRLLFLRGRVVPQHGLRRHVEGDRCPLGVDVALCRPRERGPPEAA